MVITIIIIVVIIGSLIFIGFTKDLVKDKQELRLRPLQERYNILIANINNGILDGKGELTTFDDDPRYVNLMDPNRKNIKIEFYYSTGTMTIALNYLWYHKELVFKKQFHQMRNASNYLQRDVANEFVEEALVKMTEHQKSVSGIDKCFSPQSRPIVSSAGVSSGDDDPEAFIQEAMTEGMTEAQRESAVNLVYLICKANGATDRSIFNEIVFSQYARQMGIDIHAALGRLSSGGESGVVNDLRPIISNGNIDMLLLTCFSSCAVNGQPNEQRVEKFIELTSLMGLSEEEIAERLEKIQLMAQMFGMG